MTYGAYAFSPVPLMTISKDFVKTGDGQNLSELFSISLRGTLVVDSGVSDGNIVTLDALQDDLLTALSGDGRLFEVKCDSNILLRCFPRIRDIQFDDGIWVSRTDYTINLEYDEIHPGSGNLYHLTNAGEEWQVEFADDKAFHTWGLPNGSGNDTMPYQLRLTHTVNAVGKTHFSASGVAIPAWQQARSWVVSRLGYDSVPVQGSGVFNLNAALFSAYNHIRTENLSETDGSFAVTESWIVVNTGDGIAGRAIEDFNVAIRTSLDTGLNTISIDGTIQGLESRTYGTVPGNFNISETKYQAASGYWTIVRDRLLGRGNLILDTVSTIRDLNIVPRTTSVAHSPTTGTISYSYEYDDRPSNCIANAKSEVITVNDNNPTDIFGNLTVLGKANGPVLQDLSTQTAFTRQLTIEVVMNPATGCPNSAGNVSAYLAQRPTTEVNNIISAFEADLNASYSQVFKTEDNVAWQPKEGRYSRSVGWIAGGC